MFFGLGKSGKSTLTKRLALEISMGGEFLGYRVAGGGGAVVIVDYEDPKAVRRELRRLLRGMGFDPDILSQLPIYFYPMRGEPIQAHVAGLRRFCEEKEAVALLIDSAMPACGGEPEKSEPALSFFNALNAIGVTNLIVSHVSKSEADMNGMKRPYGNVAWENMPRRVWALHTEAERHVSPRDVMLKCTATNGKWPEPIAYRMHFRDGDNGPIEFVSIAVQDVEEFSHALPMHEQLKRILEGEPGGLEIGEIIERLQGSPKADGVRSVLNRWKSWFEGERVGAGPRARTTWRLKPVAACYRCGQEATGTNDTGQSVCENHAS